jgi:hypothetical protein
MPMDGGMIAQNLKKVSKKKEKNLVEKIDQTLLVYPTENKVLRFYGDTMLLIGSLFTNLGLRYGGVYEYEFDDLEG